MNAPELTRTFTGTPSRTRIRSFQSLVRLDGNRVKQSGSKTTRRRLAFVQGLCQNRCERDLCPHLDTLFTLLKFESVKWKEYETRIPLGGNSTLILFCCTMEKLTETSSRRRHLGKKPRRLALSRRPLSAHGVHWLKAVSCAHARRCLCSTGKDSPPFRALRGRFMQVSRSLQA